MTTSTTAEPKIDVDRKTLNLWQKLAYIKTQVRNIPKNGWNKHFEYKFVQASDVYDVVGHLMGVLGVLLLPKGVEVLSEREARSGSILCARFRWEFINADAPAEREAFESIGEGQDSGDKRGYKATTGGEKYALISAFQIPTGLDPERDELPAGQDSGGSKQNRQAAREQRQQSGQKPAQQQQPAKSSTPPAAAAPGSSSAPAAEPSLIRFDRWQNVPVQQLSNEDLTEAYSMLREAKGRPDYARFQVKAETYMRLLELEAKRRSLILPKNTTASTSAA